MKCNECAELIDQFLDDELDARLESEFSGHIGGCGDCKTELLQQRREKLVYAQFLCEISPADDLSARFGERFSAEFGKRNAFADGESKRTIRDFIATLGLTPSLAAAVALLVIGIGLIATRSDDGRMKQAYTVEPSLIAELPRLTDIPGHVANPNEKSTRFGKTQIRRVRPEIIAGTGPNPRPFQTQIPQFEDPDAIRRQTISELQFFDGEVSKQVEKVELLLRSFRNARVSDTTETYDVSYERDQARTLLNVNARLRDKASSIGTPFVVETLEKVEPYLLEISNLDRLPSPAEVLEIKKRMRDQGVIANLQVFKTATAED